MQLIDLGQEVEYIDIDVSKVPYTFSVKLSDKTYSFTIPVQRHRRLLYPGPIRDGHRRSACLRRPHPLRAATVRPH